MADNVAGFRNFEEVLANLSQTLKGEALQKYMQQHQLQMENRQQSNFQQEQALRQKEMQMANWEKQQAMDQQRADRLNYTYSQASQQYHALHPEANQQQIDAEVLKQWPSQDVSLLQRYYGHGFTTPKPTTPTTLGHLPGGGASQFQDDLYSSGPFERNRRPMPLSGIHSPFDESQSSERNNIETPVGPVNTQVMTPYARARLMNTLAAAKTPQQFQTGLQTPGFGAPPQ